MSSALTTDLLWGGKKIPSHPTFVAGQPCPFPPPSAPGGGGAPGNSSGRGCGGRLYLAKAAQSAAAPALPPHPGVAPG